MSQKGEENLISLQEILSTAKMAGASDVHMTVGIPPRMRVNGDLIGMEYERLLPPDTAHISEGGNIDE